MTFWKLTRDKMKWNKRIIILLFFSGVLFSCSRTTSKSSLTYLVTKQDFVEKLTIEGVVEAQNMRTIVCPDVDECSIMFLIEDDSEVKIGDTICVLENKSLTDRYENAVKNLEVIEAEYKKAEADLAMDLAMLEAQVKTNEAQSSINSLDSLQLKYGSEKQKKITALELQISDIKAEKYRKKLAALHITSKSKLRGIEMRIKRSKNNVERYASELSQLVILSPLNGIVIRSEDYWGNTIKEGMEVWPGDPIAEIPDLGVMQVSLKASETEYKRIKLGQKVIYNFESMPGNWAYGTVKFKSAIGREISRNSKIKNFDVTTSIDSLSEKPDPGVSANCQIIIEEVLDTLIIPSVSIFTNDSAKVVYVRDKHGFLEKEVIVAESSQQSSVIAKGIAFGDVISLVKPKHNEIKDFIPLSKEEKLAFKKIADDEPESIDSLRQEEQKKMNANFE